MAFDTNAVEMSTAHMFDAQMSDVCEPTPVEPPPQNLEVAQIQNVGASLEGHGPSVAANASTMHEVSSPAAEIFGVACNAIEKGISDAGISNSPEGIQPAEMAPAPNDLDLANEANHEMKMAMAPTPGLSMGT